MSSGSRLTVKKGSLGIHSAQMLAPSAFLAFITLMQMLQQSILPAFVQHLEDSFITETELRRTTLARVEKNWSSKYSISKIHGMDFWNGAMKTKTCPESWQKWTKLDSLRLYHPIQGTGFISHRYSSLALNYRMKQSEYQWHRDWDEKPVSLTLAVVANQSMPMVYMAWHARWVPYNNNDTAKWMAPYGELWNVHRYPLRRSQYDLWATVNNHIASGWYCY